MCGAFELLSVRAAPYFKKEFIFIFKICVYVRVNIVPVEARKRVSGPLYVELELVVRCWLWLLPTELWRGSKYPQSLNSLQLPGTTFSEEQPYNYVKAAPGYVIPSPEELPMLPLFFLVFLELVLQGLTVTIPLSD